MKINDKYDADIRRQQKGRGLCFAAQPMAHSRRGNQAQNLLILTQFHIDRVVAATPVCKVRSLPKNQKSRHFQELMTSFEAFVFTCT